MLSYKAAWYGRDFVQVDRFFPSSKTCSSCGEKREKLPLAIRHWTCESCGSKHDRDVNAAVNILKEGKRLLAAGLEKVPRSARELQALAC